MKAISIIEKWVWVKIGYPNTWLVNVKNRLTSVVLQLFNFNYPNLLNCPVPTDLLRVNKAQRNVSKAFEAAAAAAGSCWGCVCFLQISGMERNKKVIFNQHKKWFNQQNISFTKKKWISPTQMGISGANMVA